MGHTCRDAQHIANLKHTDITNGRVLARISKVAIQNDFVGVATNFCGRGHMFLVTGEHFRH